MRAPFAGSALVVEIVDASDKLEAFLARIDDKMTEGLVTIEKVEVRLYRSGKKDAGGGST